MYSSHLILISSVSTRCLQFYPLLCPSLGRMLPWCFQFSWRDPFPLLLFSSVIKHCSLKKAFLSLLAILWNSAFHWLYLSLPTLLFAPLCSSAICKASSDNHFAFLLFVFFGMVLFTISCTILRTSVHVSSGTLLTRSSPLNLFVTSTEKSYRI